MRCGCGKEEDDWGLWKFYISRYSRKSRYSRAPFPKKKKKIFLPLLPLYLQAYCAFFRLLKKLNKPHKDEDGGRRVCIFALSIVAAMMRVKKLLFIIIKKKKLLW